MWIMTFLDRPGSSLTLDRGQSEGGFLDERLEAGIAAKDWVL